MLIFVVLSACARADVLDAPGVRVHYQPGDERVAARAAALTAELAAEVDARLGVGPRLPLDVHLAPNDAVFDETLRRLAVGADAPRWALAVALSGPRAVVIRSGRLEALTWNDLRPTLAHELAHLALDRVGPLPRWLHEGLAMWASGQRLAPAERLDLERAARLGRLPSLAELERDFPPHAAEAQLAYLASLSFVETVAAWYGAAKLPEVLRRVEDGAPLDAAVERALDSPLRGIELVWLAELARSYSLARDVIQHGSILTVAALLTIVAFVRYWLRRKRLLAAMSEPEQPVPPL